MKHKVIAAIAVFEGVILLLAGGAWGLSRAFDDICGGAIHSTASSPDRKWTAYAFERDCGATTGFSSFVIIRDAKEKLDLSADLVQNEIVFESDGDYHPILRWEPSGTLQVSFPSDGAPSEKEIGLQAVKLGEQRIEYQGLE